MGVLAAAPLLLKYTALYSAGHHSVVPRSRNFARQQALLHACGSMEHWLHFCRDGQPEASVPRRLGELPFPTFPVRASCCPVRASCCLSMAASSARCCRPVTLYALPQEIDELYKIFQVLGTPSEATWPGVSQLPDYKASRPDGLPQSTRTTLTLFFVC